MLNDREIKLAIIDRLKACNDSCNSTHIYHTDGVIRGLIWTLTGEDPGTYLTEYVPNILKLAGIAHKLVEGTVYYDEDLDGII